MTSHRRKTETHKERQFIHTCFTVSHYTFRLTSLACSRASRVLLDSSRVYSVSLFIFSSLRCNLALWDSDLSLHTFEHSNLNMSYSAWDSQITVSSYTCNCVIIKRYVHCSLMNVRNSFYKNCSCQFNTLYVVSFLI